MIRAPERQPPAVKPQPTRPEVREGALIPVPQELSKGWPALLATGVSIFLSVSAAAWMSAGVFQGALPRAVAIVGSLVGVGFITFSFRSRRPSLIQYMVLPAALLLGALLVLPDARGSNLPRLVLEAVRAGGIAQPPIPFDPGWRFILVVLPAALGAAAAGGAAWLDRPKLGVFMPMPLLFAAALIQPRETAVVSTVVALVLLIGSLAVAYGAELTKVGASSGRFEVRRYARGAGAALMLIVVVVIINRAGFLFPEQERNQVIPPKKPEAQPLQADRLLFTVTSDRPGPWRLGVLDVYRENAWYLPPFDLSRLETVPRSGKIPHHPAVPDVTSQKSRATFSISNVQGHQIPGVASPLEITHTGFKVEFDPRTQTFRLPEGRASSGMTYVVESPAAPSGDDLAKAPPPRDSVKEFLAAPIAPNEVVTLLSQAPATNSWDRLQFVRNALYQKVVASGPGTPKDVPPSRLGEMLRGGEATPYEITAAEALLARWAGIPARVGYGFYSGDRKEEGATTMWQVHPRHGSTWLEAYFEGHGWVPVVGTPPRAKSSLSEAQRNPNPAVLPSEELALVVYVPVKLRTIRLLYVVVRYWVLIALPILAGVALVAGLYPWPVKAARRFWRKRWASRGLRERIAVAYANVRDEAMDLNVGSPSVTPLGFLGSVDEDPEHRELAWLVTRTMWGDLRRDVRLEDAEAAEDMAQSVRRRLRAAQPALTRLIALGSRASLRDPYTREVPNPWPRWAVKGAARRRVSTFLRKVFSRSRLRRPLPVGSALIVLGLVLSSCARQTEIPTTGSALPEVISPNEFLGFTIQREASAEQSFKKVAPKDALVSEGQVFTVRKQGEVLASLQVGSFRPGLGATRREVRFGVLDSIGTGQFQLTRIAGERVYTKRLPEQNFFLWFPSSGRYYELLVARKGFEDAGRLFSSLIKFQRGEKAAEFSGVPVEVSDLRRGEDG